MSIRESDSNIKVCGVGERGAKDVGGGRWKWGRGGGVAGGIQYTNRTFKPL